ncbi:MAG: AAA family ATPase [Oscillospiraceae bacterium]
MRNGDEHMNSKVNDILYEVKKAIVGKDDIAAKVLTAIIAGGNVLIEDVPGVGKTTLAIAFGKALGLDFKRIQFTYDTMPSDITGFSIFSKRENKFVFQHGPVMTNLLLADEINRTSSKTQAALLEAMEEKKVTADGVTYELPKPFTVIATQNPVGSAGTQMLPSSQLDRFMIRLKMGYPDIKSQIDILKERHHLNPIDSVEQIITKDELLQMQENAKRIYVSDDLYDYVARLCQATRENALIELGVSPRGALSLLNFAKAYSYVNGREFCTPLDIKAVFADVSAHRFVLSKKTKISGKSAEELALEILEKVEMPAIEVKEKL